MSVVVDEESWSGADAALAGVQNVLVHAKGMGVQHHVAIEAFHVEADLSGVHLKVFVRKSELMIIEDVVHLPKFVLGTRRLCRFCSMIGTRVRGQREEIAKDMTQTIPEGCAESLYDGAGFVAMGTGVVAVFNESDCCRIHSPNVIAVRYRSGELCRSSHRNRQFLNFIAWMLAREEHKNNYPGG
jgi:hypothetical protein